MKKEKTLIEGLVESEIKAFKRGCDIITHASRLKSYRELLVMCYCHEVLHAGLKRLEDLPPETKNEIWQETKKESAGLNKKECIELAKVVYLISTKI